MASRGDIQAGKASVTLYVKDQLTSGLQKASAQLQGFGSKLMGIGAGITAMGASITAPFVAIVGKFAELGGALDDVAQRTGRTAQEIAELSYAAKLSGSGLEDIEKALINMQKTGSKETFEQVAKRIAAMTDPAERTAAAMENWGKSGVKLLPMVNNLEALREEAYKLGAVPDENAINFATAIGDAFDQIKATVDGVVMSIGGALGPVLLPALQTAKNLLATVSKWVKENGALIRTVFLIGAGLTAAGVAITAIGAGLFAVGSVLGGIATAIGAISAIVGALLSPIGLLVIGITAGVVAFFKLTDAGKQAAATIGAFFSPLFEFLRQGFGGIVDALMAGDLGLAASIAIKTIQVVFLTGLSNIANMIGGTLGDALGSVASDVIEGDFAAAWETVLTGIAAIWDTLIAGIATTINTMVDALLSRVQAVLTFIQAGFQQVAQLASNPLFEKLGLGGVAAGIGAATQGLGGITSGLSAGVGIAGNSITSVTGSLASAAQSKAANSRNAFDKRIAGGADSAASQAAELAAELAALREQAAKARQDAFAEAPELPGGDGLAAMAKETFSTFSAAAALAQGGGQSAGERTARAAELMAKRQAETLEELKRFGLFLKVT